MKIAKQIISGIVMCLISVCFSGAFIVMIIWLFQNNEIDYRIFLLFFFVLWCVLAFLGGISSLKTAFRERSQRQLVLSNGKAYMGKIKGYTYDADATKQSYSSGKYPLILTVRYMNENGDIREIDVETYKYEQREFPLTYSVPFKLYKGKAVLTGAATDSKIQGEDELLLDGIDLTGRLPSVTISCSNCGGEVKIPVGKGARCAYCGMIMRTDIYGQVIKTR